MVDEEELEVRQMFLEEAQEYVDTMDDGLVGIDPQTSDFKQQIDMVLRAAHSLKGAAGIMQYHALSSTAHRLEDSLKIIKSQQPNIDISTERLLINAVGLLRSIILINRQGQNVDQEWLASHNQTIFEPLETYLSNAESRSVEDIPEPEVDVAALMFEQEINEMLTELETKLDSPTLAEDLQNLATELADLGEMLDLPNFVQLNRAIADQIQIFSSNQDSNQILELAVAALTVWRRSQALVIEGKKADITSDFHFDQTDSSTLNLDNYSDESPLDLESPSEPEEYSTSEHLNLEDELDNLSLEDLEDLKDSEEFIVSSSQKEKLDLDNHLFPNSQNSDFIEDNVESDQASDKFLGLDIDEVLEYQYYQGKDDDLNLEYISEGDQEQSFNPDELSFSPSSLFQSSPVEVIDTEDIDNPFTQLNEIEAVFQEFNPFDQLSDKLPNESEYQVFQQEEEIEDIFATDSEEQLHTEFFTSDISNNEITRIESIPSRIEISDRYEEEWITIDNIFSDLVDNLEPKSPTLINQSDDLFDQFYDHSSQPQLEVNQPNQLLEALPQNTTQDTISDLFDNFFNNVSNISPNAESEIAITTLSTNTTNDLFDSFLENASFAQELAQDFPNFDDFDSSDQTPNLEAEPTSETDIFGDFSNNNLSRYIKASPEQHFIQSLPDTLEDLQEDLEFSGDVPESIPNKASDLVTTYVKDTSIRLPISRLEQLHELSGEMTAGHNSLDNQLKQLRQLLKSLYGRIRTLEDANSQLSIIYDRLNTEAVTKSEPISESINLEQLPNFDVLEFDRYSELHSLSQSVIEAIVQIQEVVEDVDLGLNETEQNALNLTSHFKQLQTAIKETKMRPLRDIVGRFPRAIRALKLQHGKDVDLILNGVDLLIEQTIIDVINDPLNHLLRNAFDHGIEDPSTRIKQGKNPKAKIEITATQKDRKILITVADDGRGIDPALIKSKVERSPHLFGLTADQVASLDHEQLIQLIFEPGFTTTDEVTSLSGRGVGMDVVRTNLRQIGAEIHTQTQLGVGTTFTIAIPFTLSALRITLVEVNQMILAIPTDSIQAVIPDLSSTQDQFYQWQDTHVPIFPLDTHLQLNCSHSNYYLEDKPLFASKSIVIINQESNLWAVYTNGCWGEQEVTLRQPLGEIPLPQIFSGCAIAAKGQTIPILDMQIFGQNSIPSKPTNKQETSSPTPENSILVVDDSINVRRYLALLLKKAGFKVEQAKDGEEAIAKLLTGLSVKVVLSDVEMPRLDGYGLLTQIKNDPYLQNLPVVMLTSRSGDKHRELGLSLGAAAYFSKPFIEEELTQCLKQLASSAFTSNLSI
ncbi:chemotaxis protein histidine kinase-like protein [Synechococcus sp. PCC 7502]|uniref:hybrid sensor histidine kinase/response regulator n=1 Tax=Synechococcus sp. PCC 7502 TaxID=1173263 RepID=UPI00029F9474|nr:response regulator [Synechococcus sp. PCC 7502]AFY74376.1 chemotaxis protein histidine kinase-like protein [Synechococcus sp. PCC 7502]